MLLLLFILSVPLLSIGQPPANPGEFTDPLNLSIIPPSPEAAEFGRYGEHPVTLSNGLPSINVPIWSLRGRQLNASVSLSYHASGIKVESESTWCGLNFNLNAGGAITRTVRGIPDDGPHGYFAEPWRTAERINNFTPYNDQDDFDDAWAIANKVVDAEPDIFYYNFPGFSGSFVFDQEGEPHTMNYENLKIRRSSKDNRQYVIIAPNGVQYHFGLSLSGVDAFEVTKVPKAFDDPFKSTWYLTDIVTPNGEDTISYTYITSASTTYPYRMNETWRYGYGGIITSEESCGDGIMGIEPSPVNQIRIEPRLYLSTITTVNGSITFESSTGREDAPLLDRKLNRILIEDELGNDVRSFEFTYGYFNDNVPGNPIEIKRLRLDAIHEKDGSGVSKTGNKPLFSFDYYSDNLPFKSSNAQDHYGYNNGMDGNSTLIPKNPDFNGINLPGANREVTTNINHLREGSLKRINYPTGGYSEFVLEGHQYYTGTETKPIGGLRIGQLITHDGIDIYNNIVKTYEYLNSNGLSSGKLTGLPITTESYGYYTYTGHVPASPDPKKACKYYTRTAVSKVGLGSGGAAVGYTRVTEYIGTSNSNSGKTVSEFRFVPDNLNGGFPYKPVQSMSWQRGQLLKQTIYVNEGGLYKPLNRTENKYTFNGGGGDPNVHIITGFTIGTHTSGFTFATQTTLNPVYVAAYYQYKTGWAHLDSTISRTYDEDDTTIYKEVIRTFKYDNPIHALATEIKTFNSDGSINITQFDYPHDFTYSDCIPEDSCNSLYFPSCYELEDSIIAERETACSSMKIYADFRNDSLLQTRDQMIKDDCYHWWLFGGVSLACVSNKDAWYRVWYKWKVKPLMEEWQTCLDSGVNGNQDPPDVYFQNCIASNSCNSDAYENCIDSNLAIANDERTSVIFDLQKANISTTVIEQRQYFQKPLGLPELTQARFYEYKKFKDIIGSNNSMIQLHKVWHKYTNSPTTVFTIASINATDKKFKVDTDYEIIAEFTKYDRYGHPIELQKDDDVLQSYEFAYNGSMPVAKIVGANTHKDEILGGSYGYVGFEGNSPITELEAHGRWVLNSSNETIDSDARTGNKSRKVIATEYSISKTFHPDDQDVKYVLSAWVKTETGFANDKGAISVTSMSSDSSNYNPYPDTSTVSGVIVETKFSHTNGNWQYVEAVIDIPQLRIDGNIPANEDLRISCVVGNSDTTHYFLLDDVRFRPLGSDMVTQTYDPLIGKTSSTGNNSVPSYYEHDSFGRLHLSRDHNKDITGRINYDYDMYSSETLNFDLVPTLTADYKYDFVVQGSSSSSYVYRWTYGDLTPEYNSGNVSSANHTYGAMTFKYTVSVIIEDGSGNILGSDSEEITAHVLGGSDVKCNEVDDILTVFNKTSHVATMTATDIPNANYVWDFGYDNKGTNGTDNEVTHMYNTEGTYKIKAFITVGNATCLAKGRVEAIFFNP